jgi:hypothetical protein
VRKEMRAERGRERGLGAGGSTQFAERHRPG